MPELWEELVERAVRNARPFQGVDRPRWACVRDVFGVGSTRAKALCRQCDLDPDAILSAAMEREETDHA